jgi:RNA-directed DNA polymerase
MSLRTPPKLKRLQATLYHKAKHEPSYRFYALYDKVWRTDILAHAYALNRQNGRAPGVDGQTFADIEAYGVERWLADLQEEVRTERYHPQPVRRVMIPKASGVGERPLGLPPIRDRVVQAAAKLVLEPIFEAEFDDAAYGYRPGRSAEQAVRKVHEALWQNHSEVIDADVSAYFDTIPHRELLKCVARRVSDRKLLRLIKVWLKAPVEVRDARGRTQLTGGKKAKRGVPPGGVLSPLLSVLYMHRFIKAFRKAELDRRFGAVLVVYADDFVVLCQRNAHEVLASIRRWFTTMGLELNERKTSVKQARHEAFDFLGYTFTMLYSHKTGVRYPGATPSKKAIQRLKHDLRGWVTRTNPRPTDEMVATLNRKLRGWANYFRYGSVQRVRQNLESFVYQRMRGFLRRRHQVQTRASRRFSQRYVFRELGVVSLPALGRSV